MGLEIVYWRGSAEIRTEVINAHKSRGHSVEVVRTLEEILDRLPKKKPEMLIVDGSAGEREASQRAVELASSPSLYAIPLVFISNQASRRAEALKNQYRELLPVEIPFRVEELLKLTDRIAANFQKSALESTEGKITQSAERSINASVLIGARSLADIDESVIVPDSPRARVIKQSLDRLTDTDAWLGLHARRVSMLSGSLASVLQLPAERSDNVRTSGLLLNWGFLDDWGLLENFAQLRRVDLFASNDEEVRDALARGFLRSAEFVAERIRDEMVRQTITLIAVLIRGQQINQASASVLEDAQCVMVSEFVNRACWSTGIWDHFGAYRAIRNFRNGIFQSIDPRISITTVKTLSEAVGKMADIRNMPSIFAKPSPDQLAESKQASDEAKSLFDQTPVTLLHLPRLEPGMVLAEPIFGTNGRLVLRANVRLDQDLIWRLWELSAISNLTSPVKVAS